MFLGNLILSFHCRKDMQLLHQNVFLRIAYLYVRNDVTVGKKRKKKKEKKTKKKKNRHASCKRTYDVIDKKKRPLCRFHSLVSLRFVLFDHSTLCYTFLQHCPKQSSSAQNVAYLSSFLKPFVSETCRLLNNCSIKQRQCYHVKERG